MSKTSQEDFIKKVKDKKGKDYTVLGQYNGVMQKVEVLHVPCGHRWLVTPKYFLEGTGCPNCRGKNISKNLKKNNSHFLSKVPMEYFEKYIILEEYKGSKTKLKIECKRCKDIFYKSPEKIYRGQGCGKCKGHSISLSKRKSHDDFIQQMKELGYLEDLEIIDTYIMQTEKIRVKHKKCGLVFSVTPDSLLRGSSCPQCSSSRGEKTIQKFLKDCNIEFFSQYKFEDCRNIEPLPFDFYLPKYNICIEYNGIQHYKPIDFFGGEKSLKEQQKRDSIKKQYCIDNNITFLEIRYDEDIIEKLNMLIPR